MGVAAGVGRLQGFGGLQHDAVALAQGTLGFFTLGGFAVESLIDRLAEGIPQLLFVAAVNRHPVCLSLPALLQGFDRVNAQIHFSTQRFGLVNHVVAGLQAEFLQGFQWRCGVINGSFPQWLQFSKHFFADMTRLAPAVAKLVQHAVKAFPVVIKCHPVGFGPGLDFIDQRQALGTVFGRLGFDFFEPGFHHFVRLVAGIVKAFPQRMVGHTTLVGGFPLFAQLAQGVLHLAPTHGLAFRAVEQALRLGQQFFTQLVGTPTLPAFEFTRSGQSGVRLGFEFVVNQAGVFFQGLAQGVGHASRCLAMALCHFLL